MASGSFFKREKEKIRNIEGVQNKLQYIWDYYKLWIVGFAVLIGAGIFFLVQLSMVKNEHWFYLMLANTMEDVGTGSKLCRDYTEYAGFDMSEKDVVFNNQIYFDYTLNTIGNSYFDTFIVYAEAGTLDAITMETASLAALGQTGRLMDLNSDEASSIREKYSDRLVWYETQDDEGNDISYPVGIDVTDSILMTQYNIYGKSCAVGLGYKSTHIDETEKFLDFILENN